MKKQSAHTLIALTGGIGAGKSVLARVLRALGYPVFDSDIEAKNLMDASAVIKERLRVEIGMATVLADGSIDRKALAAIVFADSRRLARLNEIVHSAVKERLAEWTAVQSSAVAFVETAILYESGLNRIVDAEWRVVAPEEVRVRRVMARNGMAAEEVRRRIEAQRYTPGPDEKVPPIYELINDNTAALLPQINKLISTLPEQCHS